MRPSLRAPAFAALLAAALAPAFAAAAARAPGEQAALAVPPACGTAPATVSYPGTGGPISDPTPTYVPGTYSLVVSGVGPYLTDVDLRTTITHADSSQLDVTLTSPAGTQVVITTDNGGTNDHVFNGTVWDDAAAATVVDHAYANNVTATPLAPEGRLEAFRGENPNGTWTLRVADDSSGTLGSLAGWSLTVTTLTGPPAPSTTVYTNSPNAPIPNGGTLVGVQAAAGLGSFLAKIAVYVEIAHTDGSELDVSLQGPTGAPIQLTTDNGGTNDNVFNGTLFDGDATVPVTDHVFANLAPAALVSPEGGYEPRLGSDPNGVWTLIVTDDTGGSNVGTLRRWDLALTTIPAPSPSAPVQFAGAGGAIPDFVSGASPVPTVFVRNVAGAGAVLWDVDLLAAIQHTACGDLDVTLTSPAGTTVSISTDNGGTLDHIFNGTRWDDQVNDPVTDKSFVNNVAPVALNPEGRLSAFRGENPNGNWTLTITDDTAAEIGQVASWSLDLTTVPALPSVASTTVSRSPGFVFGEGPPPQIATDVMPVAVPGTSIAEVEVFLVLPHMFASDLDVTLTSPAGTVVTLTTDNGGANELVYNGTLFDPDVADSVSDHAYVNLQVATPLGPEGSFDNFLGQDPNGNWTMTIADDANSDGGTWVRWDLTIRTCDLPPPQPYCFGDGTGAICPCSPGPVPHGAPGRGCPSNIFPGGALASGAGTSSLSNDTLVLTGTDVINGSMLFYQGAIQQSGGLGVAFGDGLRCIQPTGIRRLQVKTVVGNTASYPGAGDNPISVAGNVLAPGTRHYQGWYRSASPTFCTPDTFNLTNGLSVSWGP